MFVEPKAQWNLLRSELKFNEIQAPLPVDNWLLKNRLMVGRDEKMDSTASDCGDKDDRWLSQVEIITHAGPHRRLWMGPQFIFKTYNTPSGAPLQHIDMEAVEIGLGANGNAGIVNGGRPARSNPVNMPNTEKPIVPVLIESGSYSKLSLRKVKRYGENNVFFFVRQAATSKVQGCRISIACLRTTTSRWSHASLSCGRILQTLCENAPLE